MGLPTGLDLLELFQVGQYDDPANRPNHQDVADEYGTSRHNVLQLLKKTLVEMYGEARGAVYYQLYKDGNQKNTRRSPRTKGLPKTQVRGQKKTTGEASVQSDVKDDHVGVGDNVTGDDDDDVEVQAKPSIQIAAADDDSHHHPEPMDNPYGPDIVGIEAWLHGDYAVELSDHESDDDLYDCSGLANSYPAGFTPPENMIEYARATDREWRSKQS